MHILLEKPVDSEQDITNSVSAVQESFFKNQEKAHTKELEQVKEFLRHVQRYERGLCWLSRAGKRRRDVEESYELFIGPIPPRKRVYRRCRTQLCINPDHLIVRSPRSRRSDGIIYFLKAGRFAKIGFTGRKSIRRRISQLNPGCPYPIRLVGIIKGTMAKERSLHERFARYRVNSEWFRNTGELAVYLQTVPRKRFPSRPRRMRAAVPL